MVLGSYNRAFRKKRVRTKRAPFINTRQPCCFERQSEHSAQRSFNMADGYALRASGITPYYYQIEECLNIGTKTNQKKISQKLIDV